MDMHSIAARVTQSPAGRRRLLRNHETLMFWVQLFVDQALIAISLLALTYWKTGGFPAHYRLLTIITALTVSGIYVYRGIYRRSGNPWRSALRVAIGWSLCILVLLLVGFASKTTDLFSRQLVFIWVPTALLLQIIAHILIGDMIKRYKETFSTSLPVLVIGDGTTATHLARSLNANRWMRDRVVGLVMGTDDPVDPQVIRTLPVPVLGSVANIRDTIKYHHIKRIYIALPLSESSQIEGLHFDLLDLNVDLIWAPDIFAMKLLNHSVWEVAGLPLISLNESPLSSSRSAYFLKDAMDRCIAVAALVLLSPLLIGVAIAVKRSSPGPVLFKQERHGFDGKIMKVWKFRSMKLHDDSEVKQATQSDSRITGVGKFIRRTSIDELPQLFNVIEGSMSLVGPRPHALTHNDYYSKKIDAYLTRHRIKPGITGLAQISGCRGETETLDKMQKRVEYDLVYINNWSLSLDLKILIKTPFSLFSKEIY